jgi:hypothetical protein
MKYCYSDRWYRKLLLHQRPRYELIKNEYSCVKYNTFFMMSWHILQIYAVLKLRNCYASLDVLHLYAGTEVRVPEACFHATGSRRYNPNSYIRICCYSSLEHHVWSTTYTQLALNSYMCSFPSIQWKTVICLNWYKVKLKLFLCLVNHYALKTNSRGGTAPQIFTLSSIWRKVVSFAMNFNPRDMFQYPLNWKLGGPIAERIVSCSCQH